MQCRQLTRYTIAAGSGRSVYTICICDLMHYASYALQHCIAISWTWERVCLVLEHDSKNKKLLDGNKSIRLTWRMCDLPRCCWSILKLRLITVCILIGPSINVSVKGETAAGQSWDILQQSRCVCECVEDATKSRLPSSAIVDCNFFPVVFRLFFFFLIVTINFSWQRHLHTFWWYNLPHMHAYDYYCYYYFF